MFNQFIRCKWVGEIAEEKRAGGSVLRERCRFLHSPEPRTVKIEQYWQKRGGSGRASCRGFRRFFFTRRSLGCVIERPFPRSNKSFANPALQTAPVTSFAVMRLDLPFQSAFAIMNGDNHKTTRQQNAARLGGSLASMSGEQSSF